MSLNDCPMCRTPVALEEIQTTKVCPECGADLSRWLPKTKPLPRIIEEDEPRRSSFARQAALFSLLAPFAAIAIVILGQPMVRDYRVAMIFLGLTNVCLIFGGLIFGILALFLRRRDDEQSILARAVIGTSLNGLLVLVILVGAMTLIKTIHNAKARERQPIEQTQP